MKNPKTIVLDSQVGMAYLQDDPVPNESRILSQTRARTTFRW